jgi:hypothetical protein
VEQFAAITGIEKLSPCRIVLLGLKTIAPQVRFSIMFNEKHD